MTIKIKFAAYNTHLYMPTLGHKDDERLAAIQKYYNPGNVDVVGFCEVWTNPAKDRLCSNFPYKVLVHDATEFNPGSGLTLASKYPILDITFVPFDDLEGWDWFSKKGYVRAVIQTPAGDFRIYLTHTQADADARKTREKNLKQIADDMNTFQEHLPAIVMGDLNVIGESGEYNSKPGMFASMVDTFRMVHPDKVSTPGYTWDGSNPLVQHWDPGTEGGERLDYILYSQPGEWKALSCSVDTAMNKSDHYPLVATIELLVDKKYSFANSREEALQQAQEIKDKYGLGASTLVAITNDTKENLYLRDSHSWDGGFHSLPPQFIPPGKSFGFLHVHPAGEAIGSKGCVVMRQGDFDLFLGFRTPWSAAKNKVYVECRGNHHWWKHGSKDHMAHLIDESDYDSSNSGFDAGNTYLAVSGHTDTGTSPHIWFTISSVDTRPKAILEVVGGDFTYDGQSHGAKGVKAIGKMTIMSRELKVDPLPGRFSISYDPGRQVEPINAGMYKATLTFISQNHSFRNGVREAIVKINKAIPNVLANGAEVIFDETPHAATGRASGVAGESLPVTFSYQGTTTLGESYGPTSDPPMFPGEYQVTVSTAGDRNHHPGSSTATLNILPAPAVVTAVEALNIRNGHSVHANIVDWLKTGDKIGVLEIWRGEDQVWVQHGPKRWSAMKYDGKTYVEFVNALGSDLRTS